MVAIPNDIAICQSAVCVRLYKNNNEKWQQANSEKEHEQFGIWEKAFSCAHIQLIYNL